MLNSQIYGMFVRKFEKMRMKMNSGKLKSPLHNF